MTLEQHIEELRAEFSCCADDDERTQIAQELQVAEAEMAAHFLQD